PARIPPGRIVRELSPLRLSKAQGADHRDECLWPGGADPARRAPPVARAGRVAHAGARGADAFGTRGLCPHRAAPRHHVTRKSKHEILRMIEVWAALESL